MEWLNLHSSTLDSPEVVGAEPTDRATWLFLLRYCIGQENGGVIADCEVWGDRKWQQLVRVTQAEVLRASTLWRFVSGSLEVNFYPCDKQKEVEAKRKAGKLTAAKRWEKQPSSANSSAINSATRSATRSADAEGEGEGKGNGRIIDPPAASRPRNELLDALCLHAEATIPLNATDAIWPKLAKALKNIKSASPDVTPLEISRRAANYKTHFRDAVITSPALASHWGRCATPAPIAGYAQQQPTRVHIAT